MDSKTETSPKCYSRTIHVINEFGYPKFKNILQVSDDRKYRNNFTCRFHFDLINMRVEPNYYNLLPAGIDFENDTWTCDLSSSQNCDGFSQCQTDECHCQSKSDVFYCADSSGCIAWDNLCDGIQDCSDGSDECFCPGFVVVNLQKNWGKLCVSEERYCKVEQQLEVSQMKYSIEKGSPKCNTDRKLNPIDSCLVEVFLEFGSVFQSNDGAVSEYCRVNCSTEKGFDDGWKRFCDNIVKGEIKDYEFRCNRTYFSESYHISAICDENIDATTMQMKLVVQEGFTAVQKYLIG